MDDPQFITADGSAIRIWRDTVKNVPQSTAHGRPLFDEVIFVEHITPGSGGSTPVFEVERIFCEEANHVPMLGTKYDAYAEQIARFKAADSEVTGLMAGTPLKEWPEISRSMAASLSAQKVFTVEALANLPDTLLIICGPDGRTLRTKAAAFLASTKDGDHAGKLAVALEASEANNKRLTDDLSSLSEQVTALQAQLAGMAQLPADPPPPPEVNPFAKTAEQTPAAPRQRAAKPADPLVPAAATPPPIV